MSLPLLHAGRTNPGLSAALDLRFALDKSLTAYRGPTPSFSRASTGSYFDGSGVLRYANVNIQPYSEQFSSWAFENSSVSSDVAVAPDGKTTADKVYETSATGEHNRNYNNTAAVGTYTLSFYIKPAGRNWAAIYIYHPSIGRGHRAWFDVQNGVVGTTAAIGAGLTGVSSGMVSAGNGWYRCWLTATTAATDLYSYIGLAQSNGGSTNYAGDGSSGSYVWGAQLEASSTVGTYCPTTSSANSAPRFNHTFNGTSWVSRGLLVEEQRTNIVTYSEQFNNTAWTANGLNADVSTNLITAPDGAQTADKLFETNVNGGHYLNQTASITTGNSYTSTIYVKKENRSWLQIAYNSAAFGVNAWANFDVNNGVVGNKGSSATANITPVGSGWYRCSITATSTATATSGPVICLLDTDVNSRLPSYLGDGSSGLYIWGAQLEAGAFATSYIPTTSASTTRSADVCQITGSDFSGFWNGTEGSVAVEFDRLTNNNTNALYSFFGASEATDLIYQESNSGSETCRIYFGNVLQCSLAAGSLPTVNTASKTAFGFKQNDFAASQNGAAVVTDTSGNLPICTQVKIGAVSSVTYNGHIARLRYYRKRLPNATLQQLST